ncbi:ProQ/FINO family protein [Caballeronia glebae]|uniref:ProQ/FINO family protein n=1 Tax=Caballeronia glebae TaxID=1777143 RepID=UPI0038B8BB2F
MNDGIKLWSGRSRYWSCLVEGAPRVGFSDNPTGNLTHADAVRARQLRGRRSSRATTSASTSPNSVSKTVRLRELLSRSAEGPHVRAGMSIARSVFNVGARQPRNV